MINYVDFFSTFLCFYETAALIEDYMSSEENLDDVKVKRLAPDYIYNLMPEIATRPMEQWELCQWLRWAYKVHAGGVQTNYQPRRQ